MMKPKCKLIGENGNVFNLIAKAARALEEAGQLDKAADLKRAAFEMDSYNKVLVLIGNYVEIE